MLFTFVFERLRGNKPRILSSNAHQQKGGWKKPIAHPHNGILRSCECEGGNCIYYSAGSSWSKHEREICVQYATIYLRRGGFTNIYTHLFFFLRKYNVVYFLKDIFFNRRGREQSGGDRDKATHLWTYPIFIDVTVELR